MEEVVVIVGAGPAGLAISACLNLFSIPNIVLEREDCCASLWKNKSYERLKLHLAKQFCQLPHMPFPSNFSTYVSKKDFIQYLDDYVSYFNVSPKHCRVVESASYDRFDGKWKIVVKNTFSNEIEEYIATFLVVATGENSKGVVPNISGLNSFEGVSMHSSDYKSGKEYSGKDVLVVGCGNSGMEIAYDLSNYGATTYLLVRGSVHVLTKELVFLGMLLLKVFSCHWVDNMVMALSKLKYGDFKNYGLEQANEGPFYLKQTTGRSPVIDVGTMEKLKSGQIKVVPAISHINGNDIIFTNGNVHRFETIIFATGYQSTVRHWLKGGDDLFNEVGMLKKKFPNHWKGNNGLYCVGFSSRGLMGISRDAQEVANDIRKASSDKKQILDYSSDVVSQVMD